MTEAQYETALEDGQAKGFRPMSVTAYPTPKGLRFALVSIKDNMTYREKHGISVKEYNDEYLRMRKAGFIPVSVSGYVNAAGPREDSYLAVSKYMAERQITVGTFTISRNGQPIHHGGLDLSDASRPRLPGAVIPMRLGGVTKAITAAAIHTLIREGKLSLDTQTFRLLGLKPPPGQKPDPRLNDITIRHLLEHKGGWDQTQTFDPMLRPLDIASALKVPAPPGPVDIIRYMMGQPLQFDPGSRVCPSNFGYCVLGRVIEKVSGQTYLAYVRKNIFAPLSCTSVELARSLPKYRNSREPHYLDPGKGRNVLDPDSTEEVPSPDGTFYLEAMDSTSGLIASSHDMARFLDAFWLTGERREGPIRPGVLLDSQPGSCSLLMQRSNGVSFAAFFNRGTNLAGPDHLRIRDMMQEIADRQTGSEVRYAAVWVKSP